MARGAAPNCSTPMESSSSDAVRSLPEHPNRLLVADDEHLVAAGLCKNLDELGYTVIGPAADGVEAVELCREHKPDLALLDIRMPQCNGLAAAEEIFGDHGVPVIIISAYADPEFVDTAANIGVYGYVLKPISHDQLRVSIETAWGRFRAQAEKLGEIEGLKQRLEDRKTIERAKWVLVQHKSISEPDAMRMLQQEARNTRRPLGEVARGVLDNEGLFASG